VERISARREPRRLSGVIFPRAKNFTHREYPQILWRVVGGENLTIFSA
jgi:hypothetical protein